MPKDPNSWVDHFRFDILNRDEKPSTKEVINQGLFMDDSNHTFRDERFQRYFDVMIDSAVTLGANKKHARKELMGAFLFQINLLNISDNQRSKEPRPKSAPPAKKYYVPIKDINYCLRTMSVCNGPEFCADMNNCSKQEKEAVRDPLPGFPPSWTNFFSQWLNPYGVMVNESDTIRLENRPYLQRLSNILHKYQNKPRVIANYLGWIVVAKELKKLNNKSQSISYRLKSLSCKDPKRTKFKGYLLKAEKEVKLEYNKKCFRKTEERWKKCLDWSNIVHFKELQRLTPAAMSMYVRKHFNPRHKDVAKEMERGIRQAFYRVLENAEWMANVTKNNAIKKLDAMGETIAYPDELVNQTFIDGLYKGTYTFKLKICILRFM